MPGWKPLHLKVTALPRFHALLTRAGASNRELMSQAVLLEHHNRQCDHDTEARAATWPVSLDETKSSVSQHSMTSGDLLVYCDILVNTF
jgi:hypothetical protein